MCCGGSHTTISECIRVLLLDRTGLTLTAYCGDRVLAEQTDEQTDRLIFYGEPTPEAVGPLDDIICKQVPTSASHARKPVHLAVLLSCLPGMPFRVRVS